MLTQGFASLKKKCLGSGPVPMGIYKSNPKYSSDDFACSDFAEGLKSSTDRKTGQDM
jgi:hypothetical protein